MGGFGKFVNLIKGSIVDPIVLDEGFAVVVCEVNGGCGISWKIRVGGCGIQGT